MTEAQPPRPARPTEPNLSPAAPAPPPEPAPPAQRDATFLYKEYDAMLSLYTHASDNAQAAFNFYLTFIATVVGAVIVILQITPASMGEWQGIRLTLSGILLFAALVGTVYLTAISTRYAHAYRYAATVDALRRQLIRHQNPPLPAIYRHLFAAAPRSNVLLRRGSAGLSWLYPTSSYQFFIALTISASLAAVTWFFVIAWLVTPGGQIVVGAAGVFVVTLSVCNIYSRLLIGINMRRMGVRLSHDEVLPRWMIDE